MLDLVKDERHLATYDQVIKELAQQMLDVPTSMFGAGRAKGIRWKKEYRMDFDEHQIRR